ncbi:MAG: methyltransferase domain-containing protein [Pseudorhodoplanes sp.]|nr:methyltransferase domain-containing protein [Pseudorhodoplanes sp.]
MEPAALAAHAGRGGKQEVFGTHECYICHKLELTRLTRVPVPALFLSSGDLIADRRYEWAREAAAAGDFAAAADVLAQAVELAPSFAAAWFLLGEMHERLADRDGAVTAFRAALAADPGDRHGAALHLARLGAMEPQEMPQAYVRSLFDDYAPRFESSLVEKLDYRAPALLRDAVLSVCKDTGRPARFGSMLDLGCGTGLAGEAFRAHVDWLEGVDLSPAMIAQARRKVIYDRLQVADLTEHLRDAADASARHHLIVAADVFVYCRDLAPLFASSVRVLAPDGLFAFTVETHDGEGALLGERLRYAHSEVYVRDALARAGLTPLRLDRVSTRNEGHLSVPGLLAVAAPALNATPSQANT